MSVPPKTSTMQPDLTEEDVFLPLASGVPDLSDTSVTVAVATGENRSRAGHVGRILGLDRAIGFTLISRAWSSISGLVTLRLIARYLSLDEQGFYYTFGSLIALQIVFELGFSSVILQLASHEAAHLRLDADGSVTGDRTAHHRLASVLQRSIRWYFIASILMTCSVIPVGIYFFAHAAHKHPHHTVGWLLPWCASVFAAAFTFQIDPVFSFLEGCGFVSQVARTRLCQAVCGTLLAWTTLWLHHGLLAPALLIGGQAIVGSGWILSRRKLLLSLLRLDTEGNRITWAEVWPFQWRIAVSWLSGYFISQLFNPILLWYWGPVAAGQMGMSLTLMNALSSVALAWVYTKAAPFGQMVARKEYATLDRIFFGSMTQSVILCAGGSLVLWYGDLYLHTHHSPFAARLLEPLPFGILMGAPVLTQIVSSLALYLRAHKQEKLLTASVAGAICTSLCTYFLGKHFGALGMVSGYVATGLFVGLTSTTYIFRKYRRIWHTA